MVGSLLYARAGAIGVCVLNAVSYVAGSIGAWGMAKHLRSSGESTEAEAETRDGNLSQSEISENPEKTEAATKNGQTAHDGEQAKELVPDQGEKSSFGRELAENVRLWCSHRPLVVLTVNAMLFNIAIGIVMTLLVPYSLETVGISVAALGFLSAPGVALGVAGPVVIPRVQARLEVRGTILLATGLAAIAAGLLSTYVLGRHATMVGAVLVLALAFAVVALQPKAGFEVKSKTQIKSS